MTTTGPIRTDRPPASSPRGRSRRNRLPSDMAMLGGIGVLLAVGVWWAAAGMLTDGSGRIDRLAGPVEVAAAIVGYASSGLLVDLGSSFAIFLLGWVLGGASATVVGLLLGRFRVLGGMFGPVVEAIRPVSSIAWVPLSIVWFGFGLSAKVFLVALAVFLVVIVYAVAGATRTSDDLEAASTMLGMSTGQRLRYLVLPSTLSEVLIGLRVGLTAGWGTVIVAELVAANTGMGAYLVRSQQAYRVDEVMAAMICFGAVGLCLNGGFGVVSRRIQPWRKEAS